MSSQSSVILYSDPAQTVKDEAHIEKIKIAIGFLDSKEIIKKRRIETFIALLELTKDTIQNTPAFVIEPSQIKKQLGISTNNNEKIRERFRDLMCTIIDFNRHRIDNNPGWYDSQILGPTKFDAETGKIYGAFQDPVWQKIKDPVVYTHITKSCAYHLKSKHCKALHAFFTRMLAHEHNILIMETDIPYILDTILCLDQDDSETYRSSYRRLNDKILSKHIPTINEKALFTVTYKGLRQGRRIERVQWTIMRKDTQPVLTLDNSVIEKSKQELVLDAQLKEKLAGLGFTWHKKAQQEFTRVQTEHFPDIMDEYLAYLLEEALSQTKRNEKNKVDAEKNKPAGLFYTMLKNDIHLMTFKSKLQEQEKARATKIKKQQKAEQEERLELKERVKGLYLDGIKEQFKQVLMASFESFIPCIKEIAESDASVAMNVKRLSLREPESFLTSSSLAVLLPYAAQFSFSYDSFDEDNWESKPEYSELRVLAQIKHK